MSQDNSSYYIAAMNNISNAAISSAGNARNRRLQKRAQAHEMLMWQLQNEYNAPIAQRARMEAAGMNPAMMYGHGSVANTASKPETIKPIPTDIYNGNASTAMFLNSKVQNQQIMNQQKAMEVMEADITNKNLQAAGQAINNAKGNVSLDLAKTLFDTTVDGVLLKNQNMRLKNVQNEIFNSQLPEKHQAYLMEVASRINLNYSRLSGQQITNQLEAAKLQMRRDGVEVNDAMFWRIFSPVLKPVKEGIQQMSNTVRQIGDKIDSYRPQKRN